MDEPTAASGREQVFYFKRYGRSKWATSAGRSLDIRVGRFYLFIDFGRILNGKP